VVGEILYEEVTSQRRPVRSTASRSASMSPGTSAAILSLLDTFESLPTL
jgi:hypothetical protein